MSEFDLIVIGGGPGGYVAAIRAAQLNMKVAVVEKSELGGTCLNWGCIPTKSLLKSAELFASAKAMQRAGIKVQGMTFDLKSIVKKSRDASSSLEKGVSSLLKKNKVEVIKGHAKFLNSKTVKVGDKSYSAKHFIIATGARAREIKGLEFDGKNIISYREAMIPDTLPQEIIIVGAGAIGIEFASFYHDLGSKVTVIEMQDRIIPTEDAEIVSIAASEFAKKGINILTSSSIESVEAKAGKLKVRLKNSGKELNAERIIVAAGVVANTGDLGLESTKVLLDKRGVVQVNKYLQTEEAHIYAIGDVVEGPWLAHKASHEGIKAVEHMAGLKVTPTLRENIPACIYTAPQIASIGLTEEQAKASGKEFKVGRFPFFASGKAIASDYGPGLVKTIFDAKTGELLGAHMVGSNVTELICTFSLAKSAELTEHEIMHTVFPHPTLSETLQEAVLAAYGQAIHI